MCGEGGVGFPPFGPVGYHHCDLEVLAAKAGGGGSSTVGSTSLLHEDTRADSERVHPVHKSRYASGSDHDRRVNASLPKGPEAREPKPELLEAILC